jgi:hypothetical protein
MQLYQAEGPKRTIRILITGLVGLVVVFFVVARQAFAVTILSVVPIALVTWGFVYRRKKPLVAVLPPLKPEAPAFSTERTPAQPYHQAVLYQIRLRNLHWLLAPVLTSIALILLTSNGWVKDYSENPLPLYASLAALFLASIISLKWLSERRWVANAVGNFTIVQTNGPARAVLLLCAPASPEYGPAAYGCLYHRFEEVESRHVPDEATRSQATISQD